MDSNGKFIDTGKFSRQSVLKLFTPRISSTIEILNNENWGTPSTIIIHTGTNDIEKSTLETCFENFQILIDTAAQKYPTTKIVISSLLVRANTISRLRSYPNVHFVNNENITSDMLHDTKHILRRKIGVLVSNLKDCAFNRIAQRRTPVQLEPRQRRTDLQYAPLPPPIAMNLQAVTQESRRLPPRLASQAPKYSEVVKPSGKHCDLDHDTVLNILKLYEMLRQP